MDIDYVITWVDGSDPKHIAARHKFPPVNSLGIAGKDAPKNFSTDGELYYNIASVLKYAPFVRKIHIVTDNQIPPLLHYFYESGLCTKSFFNIVSHDEIFKDIESAARPNFNSLAIEAVLWRIPELSEHFIYSNDDLFINAPVAAEDFFIDNAPAIYGTWKVPNRLLPWKQLRQIYRQMIRKNNKQLGTKFSDTQANGAKEAGKKGLVLFYGHHQHPVRKSTFEDFDKQNPQILKKQVSYRYRNVTQYAPAALANHLEIKQNKISTKRKRQMAFIKPKKRNSINKFSELVNTNRVKLGCIQNLDNYPLEIQSKLHTILQVKFAQTLPKEVIDEINTLKDAIKIS